MVMMMILGGEECGDVSFGDIGCSGLVEMAVGGRLVGGGGVVVVVRTTIQ